MSLGVIAQSCFILPRRNCVMRSGKIRRRSPPPKGRALRPPWHLGKAITLRRSPQITRIRYWKWKLPYYPSNAAVCTALAVRPLCRFSLFLQSHNVFSSSSSSAATVLISSPSVSPRASIVQKRVIYFQDEGSLTIRLCEKGNDGCLSSPRLGAHLFMLSSLITEPLLSSFPPSLRTTTTTTTTPLKKSTSLSFMLC